MQKNGPLAYLIVGLLVAVLVLLAIAVFQLGNIEQRFILESRQLRALGESTERLAGRVDQLAEELRSGQLTLSSAAGERSDPYVPDDVVLRHPEVENFLTPASWPWPKPGVPRDGVLTRGWGSGDPKGFNPLTENAADLSRLIQVYTGSGLATRDAWGNPEEWVGDLAWRVEITDDFKEFTFYLKQGVRWHTPSGVDLADPQYAWLAGEHFFTAHDLVFALDMLMHPQVENGFIKSYYQDLVHWEALDDYTFVMRWGKRLYTNLSFSLGISPLPEFLWAHDAEGRRFPEETIGLRFNQHWYNNKGVVGTGPYRFERYEPGAQIRLVRNEDYHGPKPAIRELVYPIYTDPNKTLLLLKAREVGFASLRASQYREEILRWQGVPAAEHPPDNPFLNGELSCETKLQFAYYYVGWNADKPLFSDRRVRRAMTHALNRQGIIDNVYVGLGSITTGPYLSFSPGIDPEIEPIPFDLDAARALLAEAGWEDTDGDGIVDRDLDPSDGDPTRQPFAFRLLIYGSSPEWASMANIYKEDLLQVGVKMDIEKADWSLMQKKMEEKQFDAYTGGWATGWEVDLYQLWHSSQADIPRGSNRVGFRNADADPLIEQLRAEFDPDERIRIMRAFHRIVHEEQPYTFFRFLETPYCWWGDVRGVVFSNLRPLVNTMPWWVETGS